MASTNAEQMHVRPDLVDRLIVLYCDWREECAHVHAAYERFSRATAADRELAFAAYSAALDREDCAARVYAAQIRRITAPSVRSAPV
jgi:hypothetical protein